MFQSRNLSLNTPKNALFLFKNRQNCRALPPEPLSSRGWGLYLQTSSFRRLGSKATDPHWPPAAVGGAPNPPH